MKKRIVLFLCITFGMLSSTLSAEENLERAETAPRSYTRNWEFPLKELAGSAAFLVTSYAAPWETIRDLASVAATGLCCDALLRISSNLLECYVEGLGRAQVKAKTHDEKKRLKPIYKGHPEKIDDLVETLVHRKIRGARCVVPQIEHAVNCAVNMFMIYLVLRGDVSQGFTLSNYGYPIVLGLLSAGAMYNANEYIYTSKTGLTRNDRPIARIANSLSQAIFAQLFFERCTTGDVVLAGKVIGISLRRITPWEWGFYRYLQTHGDSEAVVGFTQMVFNTVGYFSQSLRAEIQEVQAISKRPREKTRPHFPIAPSPESSVAPRVSAPDQGHHAPSEFVSTDSKQTTGEDLQPTKVKEKRKFVGPLLPQKAPQADEPREEAEPWTDRDQHRLEALERIMGLRRQKNLNAADVDEEIKAVFRFLPTAYPENLSHNMKSFTLRFDNGQTHQVKYEAAHNVRGEYQGNRKDRVLDALLICYLSGWKEDRIKEFMDRFGKRSLWGIPDFLVSALWERGEIK